MKTLTEIFKGAKWGWAFAFISILLLIASFILPPTGVIDASVLAGVGEIFAFATLYQLPEIISSIKNGKSISLKHNNTEITVKSDAENSN